VLTTSLPQLGSGNGTEGGETSIPFLLSRDPEAFNDGSPFNGGCSLIHCPPGATPHGGNREPPWKGSRAGRKSVHFYKTLRLISIKTRLLGEEEVRVNPVKFEQ